MKKTSLAVLAISALSGCSQGDSLRDLIAPRAAVKAPLKIAEAFSLDVVNSVDRPQIAAGKKNSHLVIQKSALEKEFLLHASMIAQTPTAMPSGLKSRVVAFRLRDDQLFLMEATQGHVITNDLKVNLILTSFPVLEETETTVTFDFNKGMSKIFVAGDWYAQDFAGPGYQPTFDSVAVDSSFIESNIELTRNTLVIRQVAQLRGTDPSGMQLNSPAEVKYYLSPYNPDPSFRPVKSEGHEHSGYFEVFPQFKVDGSTVVMASKFNENKPIVFAVSGNTPKEYKDAVRDGILYWNQAFGKDIVQVQDAPTTASAPEFDNNIVQWVPWDSAGFAYADGQMDPRSGEILHAQVVMTSVFAFSGKERAREVLRNLDMYARNAKTKQRQISLAGFQRQTFCNYEAHEALRRSLTELLESNASDDVILKASQDYVREVIAHEIGHTLGLRHNFAGSLATNFPLAIRGEIFKSYLRNKKAPAGVVTSSSVMEYQLFEEGTLTGAQIADKVGSLSYDKAAIQNLYSETKIEKEKIPAFCTDTKADMFGYSDCQRFDTGSNPIEHAVWLRDDSLTKLPNKIIQYYITMVKTPPRGHEPRKVEEVPMSPKAFAQNALSGLEAVLSGFTSGAKSVLVRRTFPFVSDFNEKTVLNAELASLETQLTNVGGISKLIFVADEEYVKAAKARLALLLADPRYTAGEGREGRPFEFTETELAHIRTTVEKVFDAMPTALIEEQIRLFGMEADEFQKMLVQLGLMKEQSRKIVDHALGNKLAVELSRFVDHVLFKTSGSFIEAEVEVPVVTEGSDSKSDSKDTKYTKKKVKLPQYQYQRDMRKRAVALLAASRADSPVWAMAERAALAKKLQETFVTEFGVAQSKLATDKLTPEVARWVLENAELLAALGGGEKKE